MNQPISSSHFSNSSGRVASSRVTTHSYTPMSKFSVFDRKDLIEFTNECWFSFGALSR